MVIWDVSAFGTQRDFNVQLCIQDSMAKATRLSGTAGSQHPSTQSPLVGLSLSCYSNSFRRIMFILYGFTGNHLDWYRSALYYFFQLPAVS